MIRYALGLVFGFGAVAAVWCGLFYLSLGMYETLPDRKLGAWLKIKREAANATRRTPRIVLVGGSNVLYGLRAALLQEQLGVPAVNLGAHAALPFTYLVSFWKANLRRGDLLVLSIEWRYLVRDSGSASDVFVGYLLGGDPDYLWTLPLREQARFVFSASLSRLLMPLYLSRLTNNQLQKIFREWALACDLHENGDFFGNTVATRNGRAVSRLLNAPTSNVLDSPDLALATGDTDYWREFQGLLDWCRAKKVAVVFVAPSLLARPEFSTPAYRVFFEAAEARYRALGVPVLTPQRDNLFAEGEMYNTIYHLNERGAIRRTEHVLPLLAPVVKQNFPPRR